MASVVAEGNENFSANVSTESSSPSADSSSSADSSPRTLIGEITSYPFLSSAALKASSTHQTLCGKVPMYGRLTGVAIYSASTLLYFAHSFSIVRLTATKVDGYGLHAFDKLKKVSSVFSFPTKRGSEVPEGESPYPSLPDIGKATIDGITRLIGRGIEIVLKTTERICYALVIGGNCTFSWILQKILPRILLKIYNKALLYTAHQIERLRQTIKHWYDGDNVDGTNLIMRSKVIPRKAKNCSLWSWVSLPFLGWTFFSCRSDTAATTTAKKRRLPESTASSSDDECTTRDLLERYDEVDSASQDPNYAPSDQSTVDSMEYNSSSSSTSSDDDEEEMAVDQEPQESESIGDRPESPKIVVTQHFTQAEPMETTVVEDKVHDIDTVDGKAVKRDIPEQALENEINLCDSIKAIPRASATGEDKENGPVESEDGLDGPQKTKDDSEEVKKQESTYKTEDDNTGEKSEKDSTAGETTEQESSVEIRDQPEENATAQKSAIL